MARTTRSPKPIESFGPEVMQALIEGSKREIVLELPYRKAAFFRQRANALRAEMRRQNHQLYSAISAATIKIVWGEEAGMEPIPLSKSSRNVRFPVNKSALVKLIITPADAEFGEALKKAGVEVKPFTLDLEPNTEPAGTVKDVLADYFKEEPNAKS